MKVETSDMVEPLIDCVVVAGAVCVRTTVPVIVWKSWV